MKVGSMLRDVLRSLLRRPVTVKYLTKPGEKVPVPERYRGKIVYNRGACIGCLLCIRTCPAGAITVTEERKVTFDIGRCVFCGQCKETCPREAIIFSSDFEIISSDREMLIIR